MEKRLIAVGIEEFASINLLRSAYLGLVRTRFAERGASRKGPMLASIALGIQGHTRAELKQVTKSTSVGFMRNLREPIVARFQQDMRNTELVGMSSAPDFIVDHVVQRITSVTGLRFGHILCSTFTTANGCFTGEYEQLDKLNAADALLAREGLPEFSVAYINGYDDLNWAQQLSGEVRVLHPGLKLAEFIKQANQA